jgi:hypothetical protein
MRLKPNHIYLIVIAILVSASLTFAQESVSPVLEGMETEKSNTGGDLNFTEGEGNAVPTPATTTPAAQRDSALGVKSTQTKPKPAQQKQTTGEAQPKPEDSVLGFNFLYYIFQKYKMSDIID